MRLRVGRLGSLCAMAALVLVAPGGAAAATIVNGDFESGDLSGWHVQRQTFGGNWFAYGGTSAPLDNTRRHSEPVQAPPQGHYAAIADENGRESLILDQEISLGPSAEQTLSLLAYYDSRKPDPNSSVAPIAVPTPDTLSVEEQDLGGQADQQFRIDVMKPTAPLDSLDPADILRTVFQTKAGAPTHMSATRLTADLGAFAGQTVRLRIVAIATEATLNAGVDAISISDAGSGQGGGAAGPRAPERLGIARVRANRHSGTATVFVRVPGPGLLTATSRLSSRSASGAEARPRSAAKAIRATTVKVRGAGTVPLHLAPTPLGRRILTRRHSLEVMVTIVFIPALGRWQTVSRPVVLRLIPLAHLSK